MIVVSFVGRHMVFIHSLIFFSVGSQQLRNMISILISADRACREIVGREWDPISQPPDLRERRRPYMYYMDYTVNTKCNSHRSWRIDFVEAGRKDSQIYPGGV